MIFLNKKPNRITGYGVLRLKDCPFSLPFARSMTQATIDYHSLEPQLHKWYNETTPWYKRKIFIYEKR